MVSGSDLEISLGLFRRPCLISSIKVALIQKAKPWLLKIDFRKALENLDATCLFSQSVGVQETPILGTINDEFGLALYTFSLNSSLAAASKD